MIPLVIFINHNDILGGFYDILWHTFCWWGCFWGGVQVFMSFTH